MPKHTTTFSQTEIEMILRKYQKEAHRFVTAVRFDVTEGRSVHDQPTGGHTVNVVVEWSDEPPRTEPNPRTS